MTERRHTDLGELARRSMEEEGLAADFPADVLREAGSAAGSATAAAALARARDLRDLLWSSIDNSTSRDLDQLEYAEALPGGGARLLIGIADVDAFVPKDSATDRHARLNTVSVYTPAFVFHLLPPALSTDATSLLEGRDRLALVVELVVDGDGKVSECEVYPAHVRNRAKLRSDNRAFTFNSMPVSISLRSTPSVSANVTKLFVPCTGRNCGLMSYSPQTC